jgi:dipeptidyl aminopeptidase/acylaminoacyl peptidase
MAAPRPAAGVKEAPYVSWRSPITSDLIVAEAIRLLEIRLDGEDIYWLEMRPSEEGRYVVVKRSAAGSTTDVTPPGFNARTRVHEYGGGAYAVSRGTVWFSNYDDLRLYRQDPGQKPVPITPTVDLRYADAVIDWSRGRLVCVREERIPGGEPVNTLASLDLDGNGEQLILVSENDFYSSPRLSPDGARLAWLSWNHPNMPWDGTELWVGELDREGRVWTSRRVAGGEEDSIFQPEWSPDGVLYFTSDRTGWWNIYSWRLDGIEGVTQIEAELGAPQWAFGMSTYAFESPGRIASSVTASGTHRIALVDTGSGRLEPLETAYSQFHWSIQAGPGFVVFVGGSPTEPPSIVHVHLPHQRVEVLRRAFDVTVDPSYISIPEPIEFPTEHGLTAHAFLYRPHNPDYVAPAGEHPPLIVLSHGGPTAATSTSFSPSYQYWTSRGFALLDVNYGGSTGYGRAYRQRLNGQWGVVDVDDCVNGARFLTSQGLVDPNRMAISGASAGGYTALCAITFRNVFKAGASHFGISELEVFTKDTHKFESRYMDRLVGHYPEKRDVYRERSALNHVDRISCPVILFQGSEDEIVPPSQAELIVAALRKQKLAVAYLLFEGEQHGFRRAENIKRALDGEFYFYSKIFGFQPADPIEPVEIENLEAVTG